MALDAANVLEEEGIKARVINMSTIKPIDEELIIKAAKECGKIVTVEEHSIIGGLGSAVCEVVTSHNPVIVKRVGIKDQFGQSGKPQDLLIEYGLNPEAIIEAVKN